MSYLEVCLDCSGACHISHTSKQIQNPWRKLDFKLLQKYQHNHQTLGMLQKRIEALIAAEKQIHPLWIHTYGNNKQAVSFSASSTLFINKSLSQNRTIGWYTLGI